MDKRILISDILKAELKTRQDRNKEYSLRSLAMNLQVSPSFLSNIITKKISPTSASISKIGYKLGLNENEINKINQNEIIKKLFKELKKNTPINISQNDFLIKCSELLIHNNL